MHTTYENLRELAKLYTGSTDFSELAFEYQVSEGENPIVFSVAYCAVYPFIVAQARKFYSLTESDKISYSLEEVHKALLDYDPDKGAKFLTMLNKYLNARFRVEMVVGNYDKRKANNSALQKFEYTDVRIEEVDEYKTVDLLESLETFDLTPNELRFCKMVIADNGTIKGSDIAARLGITPAGVNWIKSSLKRKLGGTFLGAMA